MSSGRVRTRIAPSPTGEPHVGTAYIALFNIAYAKSRGGQFILRIEDTDRERSRPEWEREIMAGLRWLGLDWDEGPDKGGPYGPYRQSERQHAYAEHVEILLRNGSAYRCFCTKERLDQVRAQQREAKQTSRYDGFCRSLTDAAIRANLDQKLPFVVRMKFPTEGKAIVKDELRGEVEFENSAVDDQVLLKSDGFPTYHLANVVDDHLMEITDVIRAEEWISSTPKHVELYKMFGWTAPRFFHMPLLRNVDRSKISKRKNPVSILDYKDRGFLPEAVLNYLGMMGWTMPDGRELFSVDEFIREFTFDRISLGGPVFDLEKLTWLNGKYYREKLSDADITKIIREQLMSESLVSRLVPLVKERIDLLEQFIPATEFFFSGDVTLDIATLKPPKKTARELAEIFEKLCDAVDTQSDFSAPALEKFCREFADANGWKPKDLFMPLRVAITGRAATPPLFDTMSVLGRAKIRRRLRSALQFLKQAIAAETQRTTEPPKS